MYTDVRQFVRLLTKEKKKQYEAFNMIFFFPLIGSLKQTFLH